MRQVYSYLYNCLKKYKLLVLMLVLIGLFWGLMETLLPYLLKLIIDHAVLYKNEDHLNFRRWFKKVDFRGAL